MIWYVLIIAFFASVWMIAGTAGLGFPGNLLGVIVAIGGSILFAVIMFLLPIFAILLLPSELRGQHGPMSVRSLVVGVGCALTLWLGALL
jgi:hypothetical protein